MTEQTDATSVARPKYGTDVPHEPTDEFVVHAFAEGARYLWPDSRDPGWHVTFRRWLATREAAAEGRADEAEWLLRSATKARDRAEHHAEALESEVERVSTERDDYRASAIHLSQMLALADERATSAEAEVERLRSALAAAQ